MYLILFCSTQLTQLKGFLAFLPLEAAETKGQEENYQILGKKNSTEITHGSWLLSAVYSLATQPLKGTHQLLLSTLSGHDTLRQKHNPFNITIKMGPA